MSIAKILPLFETLPRADKFQLIQLLLSDLAQEENISLEVEDDSDDTRSERIDAIFQRMADRRALSSFITDPLDWQRELFKDRQ